MISRFPLVTLLFALVFGACSTNTEEGEKPTSQAVEKEKVEPVKNNAQKKYSPEQLFAAPYVRKSLGVGRAKARVEAADAGFSIVGTWSTLNFILPESMEEMGPEMTEEIKAVFRGFQITFSPDSSFNVSLPGQGRAEETGQWYKDTEGRLAGRERTDGPSVFSLAPQKNNTLHLITQGGAGQDFTLILQRSNGEAGEAVEVAADAVGDAVGDVGDAADAVEGAVEEAVEEAVE